MATNAVHTIAELELSQAAYDEIERKLLEAGYDHVFVAGPGSAIDMAGIVVTREPQKPEIEGLRLLREAGSQAPRWAITFSRKRSR